MGWVVEGEAMLNRQELENNIVVNNTEVRFFSKREKRALVKYVREFLKGREQVRIIRQNDQLMVQDATGVAGVQKN